MNETEKIELTAERKGAKHCVTLRRGAEVLYLDTLDLASAAARKGFTAGLLEKYPGLCSDVIDARLMALAAGIANDAPKAGAALVEVDVRLVVRPELLHTVRVSGITVSVPHDDEGETLAAKWRTYLRWADGKREVIDAPKRLTLPDGSTLYVSPDPGTPDASIQPAWSMASRAAWIAGTPAPEPKTLYWDVRARIHRYLDFTPDSREGIEDTLTMWTMLTYVFPAWDAVPYLRIGGPMGSGKSRVLDVLHRLVFRPMPSSNVSASVLFRTLHHRGGVLLLDEAERLKSSDPAQFEIQSILLAGNRRGGRATRNEVVDDKFVPVDFIVYGPKAIASIGDIPPTLSSRSIPISMFRAPDGSTSAKLRIDADPDKWQSVRDDLHVLALEHGPTLLTLADRRDVIPDAINNRNSELWQPLLALASWFQDHGVCGLLARMQKHALASVASAKDDQIPEADEMLLELLVERLRAENPPTSSDLLIRAKERDESTFGRWGPKGVSSRLKVYGITPGPKYSGERRYSHDALDTLKKVQATYGIALGFIE